MNAGLIWVWGCVIIPTSFLASVSAQDGTASITGEVTDTTGARIPNVSVELTLEQTLRTAYRSSADGNGVYALSGLNPGEYTLALSTPGFWTFRLKGVILSIGQHRVMPPVQMAVASWCSETLSVDYVRLLDGVDAIGELAGSVRVDQGSTVSEGPALAGVDVGLFCNKQNVCAMAKTDVNGEFVFRLLKPGQFSLLVSYHGFYSVKRLDVEAQNGRRVVYRPVYLERCPGGDCDSKRRPKKPLVVCE